MRHTKASREGADLQADQHRTKDFFLVAVHVWLDSSDHSGAYKVTLLVVLHLDASPIQFALSTLVASTHMLASEAIVGPSHTELVQHVVQCALSMTV